MTRDGGAATVAMLQAFVADAEDVYEATAERLAALVAAPVPCRLESATAVAEDLGTLVAGLHAALATPPADAPDLAPRPATHDELKAWRLEAHRQLNAAIAAVAAVDPAPPRSCAATRPPSPPAPRGSRPSSRRRWSCASTRTCTWARCS